MTNKIYVAGLSYDATDTELKEYFSSAGTVLSAKVIVDRDTNQGRGFGFVEMSNEEEAQKAITTLNGTQFKNRSLIVKEAKPQAPKY